MMMNKKLLIVALAFLAIANAFLIFKIYKLRKEQELFLNNMEVKQTRELMAYDLNFRSLLLNNHSSFENVAEMTNNAGRTDVNPITQEGTKLVARFTQYHCRDCVSYFLSKLKTIAERIGSENIILLTSYENPKNLNLVKKEIGIESMETINVESIHMEAEEHGYPYFFMLNQGRIADVFFPEKTVPSITNTYLDIMIEKYGFTDVP